MMFSGVADVREWYDDAAAVSDRRGRAESRLGPLFGYRGSFDVDWRAVEPASAGPHPPEAPGTARLTGGLMKIVIPGGSGQVGTVLARAFHGDGHEVVVLSRRPSARPWRVVPWDGGRSASWADEIDGADVVINLAGRSVNCRYNAANRREIMESRVESTRAVGQAIAQRGARRRASGCRRAPPRSTRTATMRRTTRRPASSAATSRTRPTPGASASTSRRAWERALDEATTARTRKVALRSAMTMSPDRGGIFDVLLASCGAASADGAGDGRQYVSWIHDEDFVRAVRWLIEHDDVDGAVNLAAPNPLPNAEFMRDAARGVGHPHRPAGDAWMLEIGAFFMRHGDRTGPEEPPRRSRPAARAGFTFEFPTWPEAARDLFQRWRLGELVIS